MGDHNAIINGATLELVSAAVDSDGDGLWDAWEMENFGNLNQKGTDDPDGDGLTNAQEFTSSTDPNKADSDGDGLSPTATKLTIPNRIRTTPIPTAMACPTATKLKIQIGSDQSRYRRRWVFGCRRSAVGGNDPLKAEAVTKLGNIDSGFQRR